MNIHQLTASRRTLSLISLSLEGVLEVSKPDTVAEAGCAVDCKVLGMLAPRDCRHLPLGRSLYRSGGGGIYY